ncbi:MAG: aminotransferase class III-fold pyridoxal phosphate-dependent enzyme [Acidobacteriota bacterium]
MTTSADRFSFLPGRSVPLDVASGDGCYLIERSGRRVLDAAGGAIVVNVGHGRADLAAAFSEAAAETGYVVPTFATDARLRLVDRLRSRWLPPCEGEWFIAFGSGGSEAMDMALRLARQHHLSAGRPERWKILGRELSYHGATLATLAVGGHLSRRKSFEPLMIDRLARLPRAPATYCLRCPPEKDCASCGEEFADAVAETFEKAGPETVAAFVLEPIVGSNAGAIVPPDDYLPRVAEICRHHGVLLISDEVMTGFGRTGTRFGVDHWDVVPDILVGGKGLTSGYAPLAAVCAQERVVEPMAQQGDGLMFYTYGAHSGCCAVADKALEVLEAEELLARVPTAGSQLERRLREELGDHPHVADIRGRGLLWGVELVRDRDTLESFSMDSHLIDRFVAEGLRRDVFFYPGGNGPARHVVCLGPPFVVGDEEIETIVGVFREALDAAVAGLS